MKKNYTKKLVTVLVLWLLCPVTMLAGKVGMADARLKAMDFLASRGKQIMSHDGLKLAPKHQDGQAEDNQAYYVFNVGNNGGFVLVSGDDRTAAIIGYSDAGTFDIDDMPESLKAWLQSYADQIAWLDAHPCFMNKPAKSSARSSIAPLVLTKWNQGKPYNLNCPMIDETTQTVTGCVATAMAQVMYYHHWPEETTTAIPGYTTRNGKFTLNDLPVTTFDWNDMQTTYSTESSGSSSDAVAELMQYCGWSLQMNYNTSSGSYNAVIPYALKAYFSYDNSVEYARRSLFSYEDWVELIYDELAGQRPVILGGQSAGAGHSFVCDGYDQDDYFHINWGWGGKSDGYYRLALLNPDDQGIGGSSTLDGFNYGQDAIIGIKPGNGATSARCLSLESFTLGESKIAIFTRTSSADVFSGISLSLTLCSYIFGTHDFNYAVLLTEADGTVRETIAQGTVNSEGVPFNKDQNIPLSNLSLGNGLSDGTYYIKVACQLNGAEDWIDCYGSRPFQMTATIADNQLTITAPFAPSVSPSVTAFNIDGDLMVGYSNRVNVELKGGSSDFYGNLVLQVQPPGSATWTTVMGRAVEIPANKDVSTFFTFIPSVAGTNKLRILADDVSICQDYEINVVSSDATYKMTLGVTFTPENIDNGDLYGNGLRATVRLTNNSTEVTYVGTLNCSVRQYTDPNNDDFTGIIITHYPVEIAKESFVDVPITIDGLEADTYYRFRLTYNSYDFTTGKDVYGGVLTDAYEMKDGYRIGDATGACTLHPSSRAVNAGAACFVDLSEIGDPSTLTITTGSNPNCLYLLADNASVPSELSGKNVVCGSSASSITLTDGYDFYSPIAFNATNVSYSRTFTLAANGTSGWNSIMLPFTVETVKIGEKTYDWFHSASDTGKNFWLKTFTGDDTGKVYFDFADEMTANTPYIIAVPDDRWGSEWQMTGSPIVFSATDASILPTEKGSLSGSNYKFIGSTTTSSLSNVYMLNASGSRFVKQTSASAVPFRSWLEGVTISSLTLPALAIASGLPTSIDVSTQKEDISISSAQCFDLQGRKVTAPRKGNVIINNGKKYIKR